MKILVTGAGGFLGQNIIRSLAVNHEVVAVQRGAVPAIPEESLGSLRTGTLRLEHVDLLEVDSVKSMALRHGRFDACVYLAANGDPAVSVTDPARDLRANVETLINVANLCTVDHLIYFSSGAVYDGLRGPVSPGVPLHPDLPYAISKHASELYLQSFRASGRIGRYTILRFFGAYGPHEPKRKIYGKLIRQFCFDLDPKVTIRGNGKNLIDAMYIEDVVTVVREIISGIYESDVTFDLARGDPMTITALVNFVATWAGVRAQIEYVGSVPEAIGFWSTDKRLMHRCVPTPISLETGLSRYREWLEEHS